jgi:PAP2 superfamily protein
MTRRTAAGARPAFVSPAPQPAGSRKPFLAMALAGPRIRLGTAATPAGRALVLIAAPVVGLTRIHAGAHLPLDVAGGAALGLAVDAAVAVAVGRSGPCGRPRRPMVPRCEAVRPCRPFSAHPRLDLEGPFLSKHAPGVRKERADGRQRHTGPR